jgi:hypothetical protein
MWSARTRARTHTTFWYWFALPNAARSQKRRFFSPHCSNYVPNSVAACLHRTSQTDLCAVYVMICHVPLLSHTDIHSIFLQLLKTHMVLRMLQLLVSNGNAAPVSGQVFQHPRFLPPLLTGWYHKWYWVAHVQRFKTRVWYLTKKFQKWQYILRIPQKSKFECTNKLHSVEHFQSVLHIIWIPSIWILDVFP